MCLNLRVYSSLKWVYAIKFLSPLSACLIFTIYNCINRRDMTLLELTELAKLLASAAVSLPHNVNCFEVTSIYDLVL